MDDGPVMFVIVRSVGSYDFLAEEPIAVVATEEEATLYVERAIHRAKQLGAWWGPDGEHWTTWHNEIGIGTREPSDLLPGSDWDPELTAAAASFMEFHEDAQPADYSFKRVPLCQVVP